VAYDEDLADRVRDALAGREGVSERQMFGGIAFMVGGNMACGVIAGDLIVRLSAEDAGTALAEEDTRPFDYTGRPMKGWILVSEGGTETAEELAGWVDAGAEYAATLPEK
jgi:TfoX/Sxy family transcriptional regulator of competence genes